MEVLFLGLIVICAFIFLPKLIGGRRMMTQDEKDLSDRLFGKREIATKYGSVAELLNAAELGDAAAQYELGNMYYTGRDVPWDRHKALQWYKKSADHGYAAAQLTLGIMYSSGDSDSGVPKDDSKAIEWYQKAAEQGYAKAYSYLVGPEKYNNLLKYIDNYARIL